MLRAAGYDEKTREMDVIFKSGDLYRYKRVPPSTYAGFVKADSKGTYMQENIIDMYPYERLRRGRDR